jgi:hypothetical protein
MARIEPLRTHDGAAPQVEPNFETITVGWNAVRRNPESFFGGFAGRKIEGADGPSSGLGQCRIDDDYHSGFRQNERA